MLTETSLRVDQLVAVQARLYPDRVAVVAPLTGQRLTYQQLDSHANKLASALAQRGIKPNDLIGVCIDRTCELIVALLGIIKAGAAYIPLDPTYPPARLAYMIEDARPQVLITTNQIPKSLEAIADDIEIMSIDASPNIELHEPLASLPLPTHPEDLAYVIYTSGSTGRPKGVMVPHRSLSSLFDATHCFAEKFAQPSDTWTVFHSYAFDFSVWEIWRPLTRGAKIVLVPTEVTRSPKDFQSLLLSERPTVVNLTPSALRLLSVAGMLPLRFDSYAPRAIIAGGESLTADLAAQVLSSGDTSLWNFYGPTECTVWATTKEVTDVDLQRSSVSVGYPLSNTRVHILDSNLQPVATGETGELYIGGTAVAHGYLNRPDLTSNSFVESPDRTDLKDRLYRTGDGARFLDNGEIEILGRLDHQVKIRGHRVELGEIESAIRGLASIRDAAVVWRNAPPAEPQLLAYIVPNPLPNNDEEFSSHQLQTALRARLPEYMIPSSFIRMTSLPLNPNGKLDRNALPRPSECQPLPQTAPPSPTSTADTSRSTISLWLTDYWTSVLGVETLPTDVNLIQLGSTSLSRISMMVAIEQKFGAQIPGRILMVGASIDELADLIWGAQNAKAA